MRELGIHSLHNRSWPKVVLSQKTWWCPLNPPDGCLVQSYNFPGTGKVKSHSVRVHSMIRGVPITHTTICLLVLYSLYFLPVSFPNRALPMEMAGGVACPLFILLAYFSAHWFYTLDLSRSRVLVPAAPSSAELLALPVGHLVFSMTFADSYDKFCATGWPEFMLP